MARIKIGIPVVGDIREGEVEHRYIDGIGLILYTKYRNQLYSSKMHPSSVPPLVEKKSSNVIKSSAFITQDITTGELDLDFSSLSSGDLANGDFILFMDTSSSYDVKKEALADLSTLLAGTASSTGLSASSSVLSVSDLHPVGVNGANNQLITDDGDGTVTSESGLTYNGSALDVQGDITVSGGDITYGNGQNATNTITPTATNVVGKSLTISAGAPTAGTHNDIAGGALTFKGGQGKGTGAGGDIIFQTANAAGSTAHSLNALATAFTISSSSSGHSDFSSTLNGDMYIHDGSNNIFYFDPALVRFYMYDDADVANFMYLQVLADGVTKLRTIDGGGTAADFYIDADGDIYLDAIGEGIYFQDNGVTRMLFNIDTTPSIEITGDFTVDGSGDIALSAAGKDITMDDGAGSTKFTFNLETAPILNVTGAFSIDGSSTITIDGTTGVNIQEGGTNVINIDTNRYIYFHSYADNINYQNYALSNLADKYHFTTGTSDYVQNYSMLFSHNEVTTTYTYPTGT